MVEERTPDDLTKERSIATNIPSGLDHPLSAVAAPPQHSSSMALPSSTDDLLNLILERAPQHVPRCIVPYFHYYRTDIRVYLQIFQKVESRQLTEGSDLEHLYDKLLTDWLVAISKKRPIPVRSTGSGKSQKHAPSGSDQGLSKPYLAVLQECVEDKLAEINSVTSSREVAEGLFKGYGAPLFVA